MIDGGKTYNRGCFGVFHQIHALAGYCTFIPSSLGQNETIQ
jgi:hypothetical protein